VSEHHHDGDIELGEALTCPLPIVEEVEVDLSDELTGT
jgi:hypothetical protein